MSACERYQNWMVEALYDELEGERRVEYDAHLGTCAACAAMHEELRTTLSMMSERRRPDPGAEYWGAYWKHLEQRMAREDSSVHDASASGRRWLVGSWGFRAAAAVLILAAGVWIGRTVLTPAPPTGVPAVAVTDDKPDQAPGETRPESSVVAEEPTGGSEPIDAAPGNERGEAVAVAAAHPAQRYLERSQVLLLAVLNADAGGAVDLGAGREHAGALLVEGRQVRASLTRDERRLAELFDQLELILREIAHLEENADAAEVEGIRNRLQREGVMLRINLEQIRTSESSDAAKRGAID